MQFNSTAYNKEFSFRSPLPLKIDDFRGNIL